MSSPSLAPTPAAAPPELSPGRGRRTPALLVTLLAVLTILLMAGRELFTALETTADIWQYAQQGTQLAIVVVQVLLVVAVVWLLQRTATGDGRVARGSLVALVLLSLAAASEPVSSVITSIARPLDLAPGGTAGIVSGLRVAILSLELALLLALAITALVIALRARSPQRMVRLPGRPVWYAAALAVLALLVLLLIAVSVLMVSIGALSSTVGAVMSLILTLVGGLLRVLLIAVGAVLIATTTGTPRRLTWIALAVYLATRILITLFMSILIVLLIAGIEQFALWNLFSGVVNVLGMLVVLVLAILVLVTQRREQSPPRGATPANVGSTNLGSTNLGPAPWQPTPAAPAPAQPVPRKPTPGDQPPSTDGPRTP